MQKFLNVLGFCFLAVSVNSAWAGADCPDVSQDKWLSVQAMQKKIINDYGFTIKKFKIDGNCYEIYGWETDPATAKENRIEVYFNPVTGEIVKKKVG